MFSAMRSTFAVAGMMEDTALSASRYLSKPWPGVSQPWSFRYPKISSAPAPRSCWVPALDDLADGVAEESFPCRSPARDIRRLNGRITMTPRFISPARGNTSARQVVSPR